MKNVIRHLIQKENLKSMINILNIEDKVIVGNDAKNIKKYTISHQYDIIEL